MSNEVTFEHLKALRGRVGVSQQEMAAIMGVHKVTYCKYESGKYPLTESMAQFIKLMNFTPTEVLVSIADN